MTSKYDQLDGAILARIASGVTTYYEICRRVEHLSKPHAIRYWDRVVDRRLQCLRKHGLIRYVDKHWTLV